MGVAELMAVSRVLGWDCVEAAKLTERCSLVAVGAQCLYPSKNAGGRACCDRMCGLRILYKCWVGNIVA